MEEIKINKFKKSLFTLQSIFSPISDRSIDWLINFWLIDWLIGWLIDQLSIDRSIDRLIDWLIDWFYTSFEEKLVLFSKISRAGSGDYDEASSSFSATLHRDDLDITAGDVHVIVTISSDASDDAISCDERLPVETLDKLLQTVSQPMLWNLPSPQNSPSSSRAASRLSLGTSTDPPSGTNSSEPSSDFPTEITAEISTRDTSDATVHGEEPLARPGQDTVDGGGGAIMRTTGVTTGCLESSRRQMRTFFSACRRFFHNWRFFQKKFFDFRWIFMFVLKCSCRPTAITNESVIVTARYIDDVFFIAGILW